MIDCHGKIFKEIEAWVDCLSSIESSGLASETPKALACFFFPSSFHIHLVNFCRRAILFMSATPCVNATPHVVTGSFKKGSKLSLKFLEQKKRWIILLSPFLWSFVLIFCSMLAGLGCQSWRNYTSRCICLWIHWGSSEWCRGKQEGTEVPHLATILNSNCTSFCVFKEHYWFLHFFIHSGMILRDAATYMILMLTLMRQMAWVEWCLMWLTPHIMGMFHGLLITGSMHYLHAFGLLHTCCRSLCFLEIIY